MTKSKRPKSKRPKSKRIKCKTRGGVRVKNVIFERIKECRDNTCVSNAMYHLGLINESTRVYIGNTFRNGLMDDDIIRILDRAYGGNHKYDTVNDISQIFEFVPGFENNEGILASMLCNGPNQELDGHTFVIFKENGELFVKDYDSQVPLREYLESKNIVNFGVYHSDIRDPVSSRTHKITIPLLRELNAERPFWNFRHVAPSEVGWANAYRLGPKLASKPKDDAKDATNDFFADFDETTLLPY